MGRTRVAPAGIAPVTETDASTPLRPRVSVVIEGYNESLDLGSARDTLVALGRQDFPLGEVEVILVGSEAQAEAWRAAWTDPAPFGRVLALAAEGAHYYALKNEGVVGTRAPTCSR